MNLKNFISESFLVESSLAVLYNNTVQNFETDRQAGSGRVQVVDKVFVASPNQGIVMVKAQTRSSAKQYDTRMSFEGIEFQGGEEDEGGNTSSFQTPDGQEYVIVPAEYNSSEVRVSCSCLDFYYRFAVWNSKDSSLLGNPPPPYVNKTDGGKPRNPNQVPGMCKHLMALADDLRQARIVV